MPAVTSKEDLFRKLENKEPMSLYETELLIIEIQNEVAREMEGFIGQMNTPSTHQRMRQQAEQFVANLNLDNVIEVEIDEDNPSIVHITSRHLQQPIGQFFSS